MQSAIDFELASIRLSKSVFMPNPDYDSEKGIGGTGARQAEIVLSIKNSGEFTEAGVIAHFNQNFRIESSRLMPFTLEVEYRAVFKTDQPIPKEEQAIYISQVFPHALFPYLREYVSDITVRGGFPPILLHMAFSASKERKDPGELKAEPKPVLKWIH